MTDAIQIANSMKDYALHLKKNLSPQQEAILDAILLADEIKRNETPKHFMISKLRGSALRFKSTSIMLASQMELIADSLEGKQVTKQ